MNGFLHLGHAFSLSKAEFAVGYRRLRGDRCLYPFAFHCTGMPIQACADKLRREMEKFGTPPVFPRDDEGAAGASAQAAAAGAPAARGGKSKVAAKAGKAKYQWEILAQSGIPAVDIPSFADPLTWLRFFPAEGVADVRALGVKVDWRRAFITTNVNAYYDSFVRWQLNTLRGRGKVKFGKRLAVWSTVDGQPCADHDRASGEGIGPQEYTLIKMEVVPEECPAGRLPAAFEGKRVILAAATLRAETMYGQTNVWVLPTGQYGVYPDAAGTLWVVSPHAAANMAHQALFSADEAAFGVVPDPVATLTGEQLLGLSLRSPRAPRTIRVLPLLTVSMAKGTGVVTSVPSDAPDDYRGLRDLQEKQPLRAKLGVDDAWVEGVTPIPIIHTPGYGDLAAVAACDQFGVKSQNDRVALDAAKEDVYKKGFYSGTLLVGTHEGMGVEAAKPLIRAEMLADGTAVSYAEPEKTVMSRSGAECVVAWSDQWYLTYGEDEWRSATEGALAAMETYAPETRSRFEEALAWLREWGCSRQFGLGTRLPWDERWLVESLSDSTIYMAFYTVAHLLQGGTSNMDGAKPGPAGVAATDMTDAVWDYVLLGQGDPAGLPVPADVADALRREFCYWYPVDLRVSGKDLIRNHLSFFIYTHVAVFPKEHWPRAVRTNGHLLLNADKMSKSTGNFMTLREGVAKYSADAVRFALADAGDTGEDANFAKATADDAVLKLTALLTLVTDGASVADGMVGDETPPRFADRVFGAQLEKALVATNVAYDKMLYREALKVGFHEMQAAVGIYRVAVGADKTTDTLTRMRRSLFRRFVEAQTVMLAPICPHVAEKLWAVGLGKTESVMHARWPAATVSDSDGALLEAAAYLDDLLHRVRVAQQPKKARGKGKGAPAADAPRLNTLRVHVCVETPTWQRAALDTLRGAWDGEAGSFAADLPARVKVAMPGDIQAGWKKNMKRVMPFVAMVRDEVLSTGVGALTRTLPFVERDVLEENRTFVVDQLDLVALEVVDALASSEGAAADALPGKPAFELRHDPQAGAA
ncbi:hypothetical protein BU14_0482s0003 [Porphyra umbilicalis]|uniref:leucine--tRNA ligase n=1 Tax=Porphyra umbilicalis TaxID=2786 RepID=A0A1X6NTQ6_PORUM|nr:hypothetical protein BU14_0482s0003 [Porphyra umbilicalis]|eukprot:OSX72009.1 hypothetical protein BU14_0482s0003 [Porphyra umbilicalis]